MSSRHLAILAITATAFISAEEKSGGAAAAAADSPAAAPSAASPPATIPAPRTPGPADLPVVIVTADRRESALDRTTASVSVLDGDQERARGYPLNLTDRLRGVPGVDVQNSGGGIDGGVPQVRIRGAATGDTQFLLDGIPFNDAAATAGNPNPASLGPSGVERIEVVRGAQSGLYGSRATGGVINLLSVHPTDDAHGFARAEGGSYGTARLDAGLTGPLIDGFGYAVSVHGLRSDGFSAVTDPGVEGDAHGHEPDGLWRAGGQARLEKRLRDGGSVYASWHLTRIDQDYDGAGADDAASVFEYRFMRLASGVELPLGRHLTVAGDVAYSSYDRLDPSIQTSFGFPLSRWFNSQETYADLRMTWTGIERVTLTTGVDTTRQDALIEDTEGARTVDQVEWLGGGWVQAVYADRLVELSATVRQDLAARSDDAATWRLGAALFLLDDALKPHAAVSTGFRTPSLSERFENSAFTTGNPDLRRQRSLSVEGGVTMRDGRGHWLDATAFHTVIDDRIEADFAAGTLDNDPGTVEFYGIEIGAHGAWWDRRLVADLTYTWTESDDAGANVRFTPRHRWFASIASTWARPWVSLTIEHSGSSEAVSAVDFATPIVLDAYTLIGLTAGWRFTDRWSVHLRLVNALDEAYRVFDGNTTSGRAAYGGVEARF